MSSSNPKTTILLSRGAGRLLGAGVQGNFGGAERQMALLAKGLSVHRSVCLVTECGADTADGNLRLCRIEPPRGRSIMAGFRFWKSLTSAFSAIPPGPIIQRAAGVETLFAALQSRKRRVPFIYWWASDLDRTGGTLRRRWILRMMFLAGRRMATAEIVQTNEQARIAGKTRKIIIIPNCHSEPIRASTMGPNVVWLGTIRPEWKRPDRFLDLAQSLPNVPFVMFGEVRGPAKFQTWFRARVAELPNVSYRGFVDPRSVGTAFEGASCLVNTSDVEGFPNTFLESLAAGVPVVTFAINPNDMLTNDVGGCAGGSMDRLAELVIRHGKADLRARTQQNCMLLAGQFTVEAVSLQLNRSLQEL